MAEKIRPLIVVSRGVEFSRDEWAELASSTGLQFSEEVQDNLLECVQEYVVEEISHHQGVPLKEVESAIKKLINASRNAADELSNMQNSEDSNAYCIIRMLIEAEHEKKNNRELYLVPIIQSLIDIEELCDVCIKDLKSAGSRDTHLDIFLHRVAEIFSSISGKGPTSKACINFIHTVCVPVLANLKLAYGDTEMFGKLKSVMSDTHEDTIQAGKDRITSRIQSGRRLRQN